MNGGKEQAEPIKQITAVLATEEIAKTLREAMIKRESALLKRDYFSAFKAQQVLDELREKGHRFLNI